MERFLPGLVIAGVAGVAGLVGVPHHSPTVDSTNRPQVPETIREVPVVKSETQSTQTHRGFIPAQDAVCERLQ
jgi:hypothetical protein